RLAIGCRPCKLILDLVQGQTPMNQSHACACRYPVLRIRLARERSQLLRIPRDLYVPQPRPGYLPISQFLALSSAPADAKYHHLLVTHTLRLGETVDARVPKVRGEDRTALCQARPLNHHHQHPAGLEPTVGVLEE